MSISHINKSLKSIGIISLLSSSFLQSCNLATKFYSLAPTKNTSSVIVASRPEKDATVRATALTLVQPSYVFKASSKASITFFQEVGIWKANRPAAKWFSKEYRFIEQVLAL